MMILGSILLGEEAKVNHYPVPVKVAVERKAKLTARRKVAKISACLRRSRSLKITVRRAG